MVWGFSVYSAQTRIIKFTLTAMLYFLATASEGCVSAAKNPQEVFAAFPGGHHFVVGPKGSIQKKSFGLADAVEGTAVNGETRFMSYSVTKLITAIAVVQLADEGLVKMDDPLTLHLSQHPYGGEVTLAQLIRHTAGVPNPMPIDWFYLDGEDFNSDAKLQELMTDHPKLKSAPGAKYGYSNVGYWLLEKVVEHHRKKDFAAAIHDHVFAPLGLDRSQAGFEIPKELASGHSKRWSLRSAFFRLLMPGSFWGQPKGKWTLHPQVHPWGRGYGGLYCTPDALGRVLSDLLKEKPTLVSLKGLDEVKASMAKGQLLGHDYFGKQGGGLGHQANVRLYPHLGLGTLWMANLTEVSAAPIDGVSDVLDAAAIKECEGKKP